MKFIACRKVSNLYFLRIFFSSSSINSHSVFNNDKYFLTSASSKGFVPPSHGSHFFLVKSMIGIIILPEVLVFERKLAFREFGCLKLRLQEQINKSRTRHETTMEICALILK